MAAWPKCGLTTTDVTGLRVASICNGCLVQALGVVIRCKWIDTNELVQVSLYKWTCTSEPNLCRYSGQRDLDHKDGVLAFEKLKLAVDE